MVAKRDAPAGTHNELTFCLSQQQQRARELRRQHPEALSELDDFVQQHFDPAVVLGLKLTEEGSDPEDDDELDGRWGPRPQ